MTMEEILTKIKNNQKFYQNYDFKRKNDFEYKKMLRINKLKSMYLNENMTISNLIAKGSTLADRFKSIYSEKISLVNDNNSLEETNNIDNSQKWWFNALRKLYNKPDVSDLYGFWTEIYKTIKTISPLYEQGKCYNKLTKELNPGQLLECDFYRAVHTLTDNGFDILNVKENLHAFRARQSSSARYAETFKFFIRKNNWMAVVNFFDDYDCKCGILRANLILNLQNDKYYDGEDFYGWNSSVKETDAMLDLFDIGYDEMMLKHYKHFIELDKFLLEKNCFVKMAGTSTNNCRYYADIINVKHIIRIPSINQKKLYLCLDNEMILLTHHEYIFSLEKTAGMHIENTSNNRYYIVEFSSASDIPRIWDAINCFLRETSTDYEPEYHYNEQSYTLKPLIEYFNQNIHKLNMRFYVKRLSDLFQGIIINHEFRITSKNYHVQFPDHKPLMLLINIKYDKNSADNLCEFVIKMFEFDGSKFINDKLIESMDPLVKIVERDTLGHIIDKVINLFDSIDN
jgi:hypothetical protein